MYKKFFDKVVHTFTIASELCFLLQCMCRVSVVIISYPLRNKFKENRMPKMLLADEDTLNSICFQSAQNQITSGDLEMKRQIFNCNFQLGIAGKKSFEKWQDCLQNLPVQSGFFPGHISVHFLSPYFTPELYSFLKQGVCIVKTFTYKKNKTCVLYQKIILRNYSKSNITIQLIKTTKYIFNLSESSSYVEIHVRR